MLIERSGTCMNKIMNIVEIIFWGIMLVIGLTLTGGFIGVVINWENLVKTM
jgi:hypothetical protein